MPETLVSDKGCTSGENFPYAGWLSRRLWFAYALAVLGTVPVGAQAPASEIVLHNFASFPLRGEYPQAGVTLDSAGNLYGTAGGGIADHGVVYKVDTMGRETVLHSFTGGADGSEPYAGVSVDSAGNLYGTTEYGGTAFGNAGYGVVYKVDATGHETLLHTFKSGADGSNPDAGVIVDSAGNLYGTAYNGGTHGEGVVFKVDAAGHFAVLHSFAGRAEGVHPSAGVIVDAAGNLYGTSNQGGTGTCNYPGCGVVYRLDPAGNYTVLYSFTGGANGYDPVAGVVRDSAGNLYGTTQGGGTGVCQEVGNLKGCGVVYKLDTGGNYTVLHDFTGADGSGPSAGVIADSAGNLYGTTAAGGNLSACGGFGCGVVYKLDAAGNYTVLHSFTGGADGSGSLYALAGVIRDSAGNLYGTTGYGGTGGGVVYKLDATGQETVLFSFPNLPAGGYSPQAGVVGDSAGNLYGTTYVGGMGSCDDGSGCGVLYKLDAAGHYTVLHSFTGGADGGTPNGGVIRDSAGNLYGTTPAYGTVPPGGYGYGVVYKLDAAGNYTVLHTFTGGADGDTPYAGVFRDSAGNLYGTTTGGGTGGLGVVYKLGAAGNYTVLYRFTGGADGAFPYAGVIRDAAGNLYGTTGEGDGVVYKLDAAGNYMVLHTFTGGADGGGPGGVIRDSAGNLYGTTYSGGTANAGVVYKLDTTGSETVLYSFTGGADGANPQAVIGDLAGNLYGTASGSGICCGSVFKLDPAGNFTMLYSFTGGADGGNPSGGVIRSPAGNLFGTTAGGGKFGGGVVFALTGVQ